MLPSVDSVRVLRTEEGGLPIVPGGGPSCSDGEPWDGLLAALAADRDLDDVLATLGYNYPASRCPDARWGSVARFGLQVPLGVARPV